MDRRILRRMFWLMGISAAVRAFLALFIELGNDEVYYWTYALYPDWSHFDHPPMVGLVIQLFSLNLTFSHAFFLRLAAVVFGTFNTWLIFRIGLRLKSPVTGFYAALLFTASFYCFIISGTFILPDTPQVTFWLVAMYFFLESLSDESLSATSRKRLLWAGVFAGLALLSKYTSVFLWAGAAGYILFYRRNWLKTKELYLSLAISLVLFLPVILWNIDHRFISFTYHEGRVSLTGSGFRPDYFGTELAGQFFYNNPVNFILILLTLAAILRKKPFINTEIQRILLWFSLPLILIILVFSLFRSTLPHWTGPGYLSLILLAAARLDKLQNNREPGKFCPVPLTISLGLLALVLLIGTLQISTGLIYTDTKHQSDLQRMGSGDISLDLYGWRQLESKFSMIRDADIRSGAMPADAVLLSYRWFPAANLDYYVARPLHLKLLAEGDLEHLHKYFRITQARGGIPPGTRAWFITSSRDYKDPHELYSKGYEVMGKPDTIQIVRNGRPVMNQFVFRLKKN